MYHVDLKQNCKISKLYSDYAIDRAYNSEVVIENRIYLMLLMLTSKILSEVISLNYNNRYVIDFPVSLLEKQRKISKYLKTLDNDLLRNKVELRFDYSTYKNRVLRKEINKLITKDYSIGLYLDDSFDNDYDNLYLFNTIYVNKKSVFYDNIIFSKDELKINVVEVEV